MHRRGQALKGRTRGVRNRSESFDIHWNEVSVDSDTPTSQFTFAEPTGPQLAFSSTARPVDFLGSFLDVEILALLVEETNR